MLDYVKAKGRQGIFFDKPSERIQLPQAAELVMRRPEERWEGLRVISEMENYFYSSEMTVSPPHSTWTHS